MPNQVAQIITRADAVLVAVIGNREGDLQLLLRRQRLLQHQQRQLARRNQRGRHFLGLVRAVGHLAEQGSRQRFQLIQRLRAQHDQAHDIGGVMGIVKLDQLVAHRRVGAIRQGLQGADGKLVVGVRGIHHLLQHVQPAALVALQAHLVFGLDRVLLAVDVLRFESRRDEELGETIQRHRQVGCVDIKEIIGVLKAGIRVVGTAVLGDEPLVLRRIGILVCAQEQHVLQEVREAAATGRVVAAADPHIQ